MNRHFFTALEKPSVDPETGVIKASSLISIGDARGHFDDKKRQVVVDEVTLEQIFKQCKKLGTVKVKADHGSGVFEIVGYADNFALTADKVLADIHLYDSEPQRARLLEIAEKNPHHMGISMEFTGADKPRGTVTLARCSEVFAAALVDFAAANTSLFSAPEVEEPEEPETTPKTDNTMPEDNKPEVTLESLSAMFEEFGKRLTALETPPAKNNDEPEKPDTVATDKDATPADSDKTKTYENPDIDKDEEKNKIAEMAANIVLRKYIGTIGTTQLGKPGSGGGTPKTKHFEEHVADLAIAKFSGDQNAARAHILTNKANFSEAWKAYEADATKRRTL